MSKGPKDSGLSVVSSGTEPATATGKGFGHEENGGAIDKDPEAVFGTGTIACFGAGTGSRHGHNKQVKVGDCDR